MILQQNGTSGADASAAAFQQWAQCNVLSQPKGEELCAWAAQNSSTSGSSGLTTQTATALLTAFLGNASSGDAQCVFILPQLWKSEVC